MKYSKRSILLSLAASISSIANVQAALVLYEGFDYTPGDNVVGLTGGTGFSAAWTGIGAGGDGTANVNIGTGMSFDTLQVAGGALERQNRSGRGTISRLIDTTPATGSQAQLTADNSTIWFSVLMDPTIDTSLATGGQFGNTYATLTFGNEGLTDSSTGGQNGEGTDIANTGDAFGVGFFGGPTSFADGGIQGLSFTGGVIDQSDGASNSIVTGDSLSLIVGRIEWAADGFNDTLTLYDITDPGAALPASFATMTMDVDQTDFDTISIADGQTSGFDEIRFGTELGDVLPVVPEPSSFALVGLSALSLLRRRRS